MELSAKILSDLTVHMKYAKYLEKERRRESWEELITRNKDMNLKKFPALKDEIEKAYKLVYEKKVLPSMRALEDSTPIITKYGWKTAGEVNEGDILYSSSGKETLVLAVKKFKNKSLYRVMFSDHQFLDACDEHLWIISTNDDLKHKGRTRVASTKFIREHLKQEGKNNITIWNALPIQREEKEYEIEPYILGLWLGGGCSSECQISTSVEDSIFIKEQYELNGYPLKQSISSNMWTWSVNGLRSKLKKNNLINNKHIPREYFYGSEEQRLALLQGLMDSNGCIAEDGGCHFSNTNESIIEGVKEILSSLGIKYILYEIPESEREKKSYVISYFTNLKASRLPGKRKNIREQEGSRTNSRKVLSVEYIGPGNASCFHVDSEDNSFLAGSAMITTHNSLQFGGKPIEINPSRSFNCAFAPANHSNIFSEIMFLLLGGCGVGYSVQRHHVEELPIVRGTTKRKRRYLIGDSIEGWADAVKVLMNAYFFNKSEPIFDFSDIRDKGAKLMTSGGKAPGPWPLRDCLHNVRRILEQVEPGEKLTTLQVHDIICFIADAVLSGGIRRAALIALFSIDDDNMLTCKSGRWWELNPQRARANNSGVILRHRVRKKDFMSLWERIQKSGCGEPGIFLTNDKEIGCNPCCEISLKNNSFCNLTEVNVSDVENQGDLNERVRAASFIGTIQASYTDFHYLRDVWQKNTEKEALIGVSMTGVSSMEVFKYNLEEAAEEVKKENERVAKIIGINKAARTTCIKPAGTTSLVLGTSSGIHAWHNDYYVRRLRVMKNETIYQYIREKIPGLVEDDFEKPHLGAVISIPMKAPFGAITRHEKAIELLERVKKVHKEWIRPGHRKGSNTHNVSCTISVRDKEWDEVGEWMWKNRENYSGISVLPHDGGTYVQQPFEDCTKEEYEEMMNFIKDINLSDIEEEEDNTRQSQELACSGGSCDISHL